MEEFINLENKGEIKQTIIGPPVPVFQQENIGDAPNHI